MILTTKQSCLLLVVQPPHPHPHPRCDPAHFIQDLLLRASLLQLVTPPHTVPTVNEQTCFWLLVNKDDALRCSQDKSWLLGAQPSMRSMS